MSRRCSPLKFSIQQFYICLFDCQKTAFVCEFHHTPLDKGYEVPQSIFTPKINWFFCPPKLCFPPGTNEKKKRPSTLNITILQKVRNECVRFKGHVDIQVSYEILWLEVLKETRILHSPPCFQRGCFEDVLIFMIFLKNTLGTLCILHELSKHLHSSTQVQGVIIADFSEIKKRGCTVVRTDRVREACCAGKRTYDWLEESCEVSLSALK